MTGSAYNFDHLRAPLEAKKEGKEAQVSYAPLTHSPQWNSSHPKYIQLYMSKIKPHLSPKPNPLSDSSVSVSCNHTILLLKNLQNHLRFFFLYVLSQQIFFILLQNHLFSFKCCLCPVDSFCDILTGLPPRPPDYPLPYPIHCSIQLGHHLGTELSKWWCPDVTCLITGLQVFIRPTGTTMRMGFWTDNEQL